MKSTVLRYLSPDEAQRLIAVAAKAGNTGKRNAAIMSLMYGCGLRVGECQHLRADAVDLDERHVLVPVEGKTGSRVQRIPSSLLNYVQAWNDIRSDYTMRSGEESPYFFLSRGGLQVDRHNIGREMKRYAAKAGIGEVNPHMLRHSHAMAVLNNPDALITDVQASLGHASLSSTMVYLHADRRRHDSIVDSTEF